MKAKLNCTAMPCSRSSLVHSCALSPPRPNAGLIDRVGEVAINFPRFAYRFRPLGN